MGHVGVGGGGGWHGQVGIGASGVADGGVGGVEGGCKSAHCLLRVEGIWKPLVLTRLPVLVGRCQSLGVGVWWHFGRGRC